MQFVGINNFGTLYVTKPVFGIAHAYPSIYSTGRKVLMVLATAQLSADPSILLVSIGLSASTIFSSSRANQAPSANPLV